MNFRGIKFFINVEVPQIFPRFAQTSVETVRLLKISLTGNQVKFCILRCENILQDVELVGLG